MKVQIKVIQYEIAGRTWYRWLLKRAEGRWGRPIAQCIKPFTGAYIANKSANRMGDIMKETGCEVEVIEATYKQPDNMKYSKKTKRITKLKCKDMEKFGVSLC